MSYKDDDYEELIDRADALFQKDRFHEAWECIAAIPEDVKFIDFADDCSFFAAIALSDGHLDEFLRFFHGYFNNVAKPDKLFVEDLTQMFFTMTTTYDSRIFPYVVQVIDTVIERFRTPEVLTLCAGLFNMMNTPEQALPLLDEVLDKDPFFARAWLEKVFSYHFLGDNEKEIECCNYYMALDPDCRIYEILTPIAASYTAAERYQDAISLLSRLLRNKDLQPEQLAGVHCLIAENYSYISDNRNELIHRKKALDVFPEEVAYWSMLAQYYITSEDNPAKADRIMKEASLRFPHDPVMHYMYAAVQCQLSVQTGKNVYLKHAAEHITLAIKKYKNDLLFHLLAARIYLLLKDYKPALKYARNAYRLNPNSNSAILYLVLAYFGCGRLTDFRRLYRIYAKINPTARQDIATIIPETLEVIDKMK